MDKAKRVFGKKGAASKGQGVMEGVFVLTFGLVMVKIIGFLFKIPVFNMLDGSGTGYYQTAYTIYTPVYTLATAGLPSAVSRLVSTYMYGKSYRDVRKTKKVATKVFIFTGVLGFTVLFAIGMLLPVLVSKGILNPDSYDPKASLCIIAMAPAVFFCCLMSAYRGYYQGLRNMIPTATSEIIEAFTKLIFGIGATFAVIKYCQASYNKDGTFLGVHYNTMEEAMSACQPYAAAAAIFSVTIGALLGFIYLSIRFKKMGDTITEEQIAQSADPESSKKILKTLLAFGIPIALGVLTMNIATLVDMITIKWRLGSIVSQKPQALLDCYPGLIPAEKDLAEIPNYLFGCYSLNASLFNLIPTIVQAFGVSVLPALTAAWLAKNTDEVKTNISSILKITSLIAIPSGLGMSVLAGPILHLLYPGRPAEATIATPMLRVMGITVLFFALLAPINSMLQAIGKQNVPVKLMLAGCTAKIIINTILIGIPKINVMGAPYGTFVSYSFIIVASLYILLKNTKVRLNYLQTFIKPLAAGLMSAAAAWAADGLLGKVIGSGKIVTLFALVAAVVVYVAAILLIKAITYDDLILIPKGEKFAKILEKRGWIS